jgi:hypothetical protein
LEDAEISMAINLLAENPTFVQSDLDRAAQGWHAWADGLRFEGRELTTREKSAVLSEFAVRSALPVYSSRLLVTDYVEHYVQTVTLMMGPLWQKISRRESKPTPQN